MENTMKKTIREDLENKGFFLSEKEWEELYANFDRCTEAKKKMFYAVQIGDSNDGDYGSYTYEEAVEMAKTAAEDPGNDGLEVRIATVRDWNSRVEAEEIIREGKR